MKCRQCGNEFSVGIFCPKCGFKNIEEQKNPVVDETVEAEKQKVADKEKELLEKEKRLKEMQEHIEAEQKKKEEQQIKEAKEQERIEQEKIVEAEKRCQQEEKEAKERETAERIAKEQEDAKRKEKERDEVKKMEKDNELIEALKNRLMTTRSQEERRKILDDFSGELNYESSVQRLQSLREKANQKPTFGNLINWIYGGTVIFSIILTAILAGSGNTDSPFVVVAALWYGLGIPVWIVWRIILIVKTKQKSYYLNIKHI